MRYRILYDWINPLDDVSILWEFEMLNYVSYSLTAVEKL